MRCDNVINPLFINFDESDLIGQSPTGSILFIAFKSES